MERLFEFLTDLSGGVAYLLIFGILVACGLGFPLPEDIPLIATGYLIWDKTLTWFGGISVTMLDYCVNSGLKHADSMLFPQLEIDQESNGQLSCYCNSEAEV